MTTIHRRVLATTAATVGALGATAALVAGATAGSPAHAAPAATVSAQDQTFMIKATQANLAEISLGKVAEKQAKRPAVRRFAREMVKDHSQQLAALQTVATSVGVALPTVPSKEQRKVGKVFATAEGTTFDCAYVPFQWDDHQGVILLHETEVTQGSDPQVRAAAQAALPVLEEHDAMATKLLDRIKSC